MRLGKGLLGCLCLGVVLLVAAGYIAVRVLDVDPRRDEIAVTVTMNETGGLMDTSSVALHGLNIGRVTSIVTGLHGVDVSVRLDASYPVPTSSKVVVQNLSPAGEQYLDFRPDSSAGPYLADGARIGREQVVESATVDSVLGRIDRVGELLDPDVVGRMGELLKAVTADRAALTSSKAIAEFMSATIGDKATTIRRLFATAQRLDMRVMAIDGPNKLRPVAGTLEQLGPSLASVIRQLENFGTMSAKDDVWNSQIGPFMDRLLKDLNVLLPEVGGIAGALAPVTAQLRGIRVNMNAFTDLWGQAFPEGGPMRVQLMVK